MLIAIPYFLFSDGSPLKTPTTSAQLLPAFTKSSRIPIPSRGNKPESAARSVLRKDADTFQVLHLMAQRKDIFEAATDVVLQHLDSECQQLCKVVGFQSVLRRHSRNDIMKFSWQAIVAEWKEHAPIFLAFLNVIVGKVRARNVMKGVSEESRHPSICTAGAVLLKERNKDMSLIHHIIGILLSHGDVKKMVSVCA